MKFMTLKTTAGTFAIPVDVIARDRATHYAPLEFDGNVERSLAEDTMPLFEADPFEVRDWASNNMNWSDVAMVAFKLAPPELPDMQEAWNNGEKDVIEISDEEVEAARLANAS